MPKLLTALILGWLCFAIAAGIVKVVEWLVANYPQATGVIYFLFGFVMVVSVLYILLIDEKK